MFVLALGVPVQIVTLLVERHGQGAGKSCLKLLIPNSHLGVQQFCATWVSLFIDVVCAIYGSDCYYTVFLLVGVVLVHVSYVISSI